MRKILFVFGTRPEAIKLCPVLAHLRSNGDVFQVEVCVTAQHRTLLDQVLEAFAVRSDYDLDAMMPGQTLFQSTARILAGLEPVLAASNPDMVLVQGDTTSTLCGALAAYYKRVPVGHVEAGLRTGDVSRPFPEEMNRILTTRMAGLHFAPTERAAQNLRGDGIDERHIILTGNSGIDALLDVSTRLDRGQLAGPSWPQLAASRRLVLVTAHRRESFGEGFTHICAALAQIAHRDDVQVVYPVHPNPSVVEAVDRHLRGHPNVLLIEPQSYVHFVDLMRRAYILLTDSGGIQEEGPSLGKPVLVMRDKTERPEAVAAGTAKLVGADRDRILREVNRLLDDPVEYQRMSKVHNPYGDGKASPRIAEAILEYFGSASSHVAGARPAPFPSRR
jgi:UDP-N-acetylglucosamine 2-epimerase (non-hydrolysing)